MSESIPFNRPFLAPAASRYVTASLASDHHSGDGPFTRRATELLAPLVGGGDCLLTTSCTHALEMAGLLLDLGPGDEVIMPSFTFVSTANAVALRGATCVFVDCRPDTFNIDEERLAAAVTERTRAIVVVHYGGVGCAMDEIGRIAAEHGLAVIEDNAHGLGGSYAGRPLGSFGVLATQSFHETKNIQCGEGGALVVNDPGLMERAEILREKGTNRSRFFRGQVDKYTWVDVGSSYLPAEVLAALLTAQLEAYDDIQARRRAVWEAYAEGLDAWCAETGVRPQFVPSDRSHPAHLFALLLPTAGDREAFIAHMRSAGAMTPFHYVPLHTAPAAAGLARTGPGGCPVTEDVSSRLVRLPLFAAMSRAQGDRVIAAATAWRPAVGR